MPELRERGFTLLEVMVALSIIAIALTAVLSLQTSSLSLASEAKFDTTASLLAQSKIAQIETVDPENLTSGSGDFGENFPGYTWQLDIEDVSSGDLESFSRHLKKIQLQISWGEPDRFLYSIKLYRFVPNKE